MSVFCFSFFFPLFLNESLKSRAVCAQIIFLLLNYIWSRRTKIIYPKVHSLGFQVNFLSLYFFFIFSFVFIPFVLAKPKQRLKQDNSFHFLPFFFVRYFLEKNKECQSFKFFPKVLFIRCLLDFISNVITKNALRSTFLQATASVQNF